MEFKENKLEWSVVILAGALLAGVLWVFELVEKPSQIETETLVYEMPRPVKSDMSSDFSLGDREIIRELVKKPKKETKAVAQVKPVAPPPKKVAQKKKDKKDSDSKKPSVEVNVVDADESRPTDDYENTRRPMEVSAEGGRPAAETPEEEKPVKTLAEWRSLLAAQPSRENMNAFIKAWRDGEIDAAGFYQVVQEMLLSKKKVAESTALYGLQQVPHVMTFAMISRQIGNLSSENQTLASQILMSYSHPSRLLILDQALRMKDPVVITRAAAAINAGLERAKSGQAADPRQARSNEPVNPSSVAPFARFVPTFQQWQQSGEPTLVGLANSFLMQWQT